MNLSAPLRKSLAIAIALAAVGPTLRQEQAGGQGAQPSDTWLLFLSHRRKQTGEAKEPCLLLAAMCCPQICHVWDRRSHPRHSRPEERRKPYGPSPNAGLGSF